jgi:hypothetical protein
MALTVGNSLMPFGFSFQTKQQEPLTVEQQKNKQTMLELEDQLGKAESTISAKQKTQDYLLKTTKETSATTGIDESTVDYLTCMLESLTKVREEEKAADQEWDAVQTKISERSRKR